MRIHAEPECSVLATFGQTWLVEGTKNRSNRPSQKLNLENIQITFAVSELEN